MSARRKPEPHEFMEMFERLGVFCLDDLYDRWDDVKLDFVTEDFMPRISDDLKNFLLAEEFRVEHLQELMSGETEQTRKKIAQRMNRKAFGPLRAKTFFAPLVALDTLSESTRRFGELLGGTRSKRDYQKLFTKQGIFSLADLYGRWDAKKAEIVSSALIPRLTDDM
jgi:hypothetical protein